VDLTVERSLEHNRSVRLMNWINEVVSWRNIQSLLLESYEAGRSREGADAYPPLMLLKGLLLQKWFRIPSDPELENQINDRISFKKFLGLPLDKPSRTIQRSADFARACPKRPWSISTAWYWRSSPSMA